MSKIHLNPWNDIHTPSVCHIGYIRGTDIRIVEYRSLAILITILIPCALLIQKRAEEDGGIGIGSADSGVGSLCIIVGKIDSQTDRCSFSDFSINRCSTCVSVV